MDDLPDLAFEKVLSFLDLKELLRIRAVSKTFYLRINNFRVRSLCYSEWARDYIEDKHRLVVGEFAQNFISSSEFEPFLAPFNRSLFSGLRRLRVCELNLKDKASEFIDFVNSFEHLESLDLVLVENLIGNYKLNLPKLKSIHFKYLNKRNETLSLTLDAPILSEITATTTLVHPHSPRLNVLHPESVETIRITDSDCLTLERFKNLKFLHYEASRELSETLLASLEKLEEIHLFYRYRLLDQIHRQKHRFACYNLKIFCRGYCQTISRYCPSDPIGPDLSRANFNFMLDNYSSVPKQLPYYEDLRYAELEDIVLSDRFQSDFWHRLTNLKEVRLIGLIANEEKFLDFLRIHPHLVKLTVIHPQSQSFLDQVPLCCSPQHLSINLYADQDAKCLLKFKKLVRLHLGDLSDQDMKVVPAVLSQQKFIKSFIFDYREETFFVKIDKSNAKLTGWQQEFGSFASVEELIQFIVSKFELSFST